MAAVSPERVERLLRPYWGDGDASDVGRDGIIEKLGVYLDLLLKWNARTNLTAIREPEEIVVRHFGESLFAARALRKWMPGGGTLLDFGSGAGFPGVPIQMERPELTVVLAESQGKKAAFLRETVRTLGLRSEVWADRVEDMPVDRMFDCVAMRAVDRMESAVMEAAKRVKRGGLLAILAGKDVESELKGWVAESLPLPDAEQRQFLIYRRTG